VDDRLSRLISEHNLDAHRARFAEEDIDLPTMAAMIDADLDRLAELWKLPLGARTRLRALRDRAREAPSAPSGASSAPAELSDADRQLIELLPTPLARAANEVLKPVGDRTNADVQAAVDVLLRSLALVCQSDYFHSNDWYDPEINEMFPSLEQRPSHGTWRKFITLCMGSAKRARHACFLRELPDTWYRCENKKPLKHESAVFDEFGQQVRRGGGIGMLELLVHHRNALAHHRLDSRDLGLAAQFRQGCLDVFREYRWLGRYELWLGSASRAFLLQGVSPREAIAGPALLSGDRDVVLRRLRGNDPRDWEVLPMPPLILSAAAVPGEPREAGTSDSEVIIFSELVSRKGGGDPRINYTSDPFAPKHVSIETAHGTNELRRLQDRKSFPRVGRDALEREDLKRRIRAASERTLRVLESSGKFRRRLHVERAAYEPRLAPWIDSTVPLLGLAAEAGAGKTGILASLASRWIEQSAAPVLFVLANQHQTVRDLDRLVQDALTLGRDVTVGDICTRCSGLVIVIDGLNEHPGREDLVHRICSLAQSTLETVNGVRFAVTWRTEDDAWIREASGRRSLWWVPEDVDARIDAEHEDPMPEPARVPPGPGSDSEDVPEAPSSDPAPPTEGIAEVPDRPVQRKSTGNDATYVRIGPLTHDECAEAWRRYRADADLRLCPEFDWADVRRQSPGLARRLRNPLWMRVLMECMHGKDLPPDLGETDVFSEYLEQIRSDYSACRANQLLEALGRIMLRRRDLRITVDDLERECWDLVHPREGQSPLLALERRGMLSSIDGRSFTFAVERLAEQVIGEHVASLPAAESGTALAALAADLYRSKFSQAHGVVQESLHQRVRALGPERGDGFLFEFIDACPVELAELAAAALERRIVELGGESAAYVVESLLEDPTESDLEVAGNAARRLAERGMHDLALAFIAPFVTRERISLMGGSIRYRRLLMLYVSCVHACLANEGDGEPTWLDRGRVLSAIDALRREDSRSPTSAGTRLLAMALVDLACSRQDAALVDDQHAILQEALEVCRRRVELATADGEPDDLADARRQLAAYLQLMSEALGGRQRDDERERALLEALTVGQSIGGDDAWDASQVLWELALLCEQRDQPDRAIGYHRHCLAAERKRRKWWHASQTSFRIGRLLLAAGREAEAEQADVRALELAKASGSVQDHATALEWFGDALRRRNRLDAAMDAYQESLRVGSGPPIAKGWSPASVLAEIARVHSDRGEHAEAVSARRRVVEVLRDTEDRRSLTVALEHLGHALRDAGLHREAIKEFLESYEVGSQPEPVERWRPAIPLHWAARCHHAIGEFDRAVEIRQSLARTARDAEDRRGLAVTLDWLACELRDAKRFEEAALAFGEAYEVGMHPQPLEEWSPSGLLLRHAQMEAGQGRHDRAIRLQTHAVDLSRASGDRARIAEDLDRLGDILKGAGKPEEALQAYLDAVHAGMTPDRAADWSPAVALSDAADVLSDLERWDEAVDYRRKAADGFANDGDRRGQAIELDLLGDVLRRAGRREESLQAFLDAVRAGMTPEQVANWSPAVALSDAASVLVDLERWDGAIDYRRRAIKAFADDGDRMGQAVELDLLGDALRRAGRPEEALQAYLDAVHTGMIPERVADWSPAVSLSDIASTLIDLKRWDEAIDYRQRAVEAYAEDGDRRGLAIALEFLGVALGEAGRFDEALDAYRKAHEVGMTPERVANWKPGIPLGCAAWILGSLGRWDEAVDHQTRAVEAHADDGDRREQAIALEFLGRALREAGRSDEALDAYRKAHEVGMTPERVANWKAGIPLGNAARVLGSLGRWDEAIDYRRRAAEAYANDGNRLATAIELEFLGDALCRAGRLEEALGAYRDAHRTGMVPEPADGWDSARPLLEAARVLETQQRIADAVDMFRKAVADAQSGRGHAGDGDGESTFVWASVGLGKLLAPREGNIAALEAMEAGRKPALLIERLDQPRPWLLEPCADWWALQSTLLAAIGDRAEAEAAAARAAAIHARLDTSDPS
jgi:pentatricopeptide repeat protein